MIARWMFAALLFAALCGLAALAAERAARLLGKPARFAWTLALVVAATWPVVAWMVLEPAPAVIAPAVGSVLETTPATLAQPFEPSLLMRLAPYTGRALISVWAIASSLLTVQLLLAVGRLRAIRRRARPTVVDGESVLVDESLGPAVLGLTEPVVVLPVWMLALDSELRALVLRHEREHCRAHDARIVWLSAVVTTVLPWNVALWWIAARLRLAMEVDCDARTLSTGDEASRKRYAKLLLLIAQRKSSARFVPMLSDSHSQLGRRITAMHQRTPSFASARATLALALAAAAVATACSSRIASNLTSPVASATPASESHTATTTEKPMREFTVDSMAHLLPNSPAPAFPPALRAAGTSGTVLTMFIVNADGRADTASFKVLRSDHAYFTDAVRNALPQMRFKAATVKGNAVRQLLQQPFLFDATSGVSKAGGSIAPPPTTRRPTAGLATPPANGIYFDFQVDRPAVMAPGSRGPVYPPSLREARVEGAVLAQFVVDIDGRPDMNSFKVLKTDNALFSDAVKEALSTMVFLPAKLKDRTVKQLVQQPFQFSLNR